jgi:hypothetical protein
LKFGFRGEGIEYQLGSRNIHVDFTWIKGNRIYLECLSLHRDPLPLSKFEKREASLAIINFVFERRGPPILVLNTDDPSLSLWAALCEQNRVRIADVEYTSDEAQLQFLREAWMKSLKRSSCLNVNGRDLRNEDDVEEAVRVWHERHFRGRWD